MLLSVVVPFERLRQTHELRTHGGVLGGRVGAGDAAAVPARRVLVRAAVGQSALLARAHHQVNVVHQARAVRVQRDVGPGHHQARLQLAAGGRGGKTSLLLSAKLAWQVLGRQNVLGLGLKNIFFYELRVEF